MSECVGTAGFWAPEVYFGKGYTERCDLWSLGVVAYIGLTAKGPFPGAGEGGVPNAPCPIAFDGCSRKVREFVNALLTFDPIERPSASKAMELPLVQSHVKARQLRSLQSLGLPVATVKSGVEALLEYAHAGPLRCLVAGVLARHVKGLALQEATRVFNSMDTDSDGRISWSVFREIMSQAPDVSDSDVQDICAALEDSDGYVDYIDFLAGVLGGRSSHSDTLSSALKMLSVGDEEEVSLDHLQEMGLDKYSPSLVRSLQGLANADGKINLYQLALLADREAPREAPKAPRAPPVVTRAPVCTCLPCFLFK